MTDVFLSNVYIIDRVPKQLPFILEPKKIVIKEKLKYNHFVRLDLVSANPRVNGEPSYTRKGKKGIKDGVSLDGICLAFYSKIIPGKKPDIVAFIHMDKNKAPIIRNNELYLRMKPTY